MPLHLSASGGRSAHDQPAPVMTRDDAPATARDDDARHCERIVRAHARTFALASYFLPPPKRRAAFALYAFCRQADDMVDAPGVAATTDLVRRQLDEYERQLQAALAGRPSGPVFRELRRAMDEFEVPEAVLHELLAGVARDLQPARYTCWPELMGYCEGVASTVGEMCTYVFGVPGGPDVRARAVRYARMLGVAMQLTNILRDIGEDARAGRCYLPEEDLRMFGLCVDDVLANPALARDERWRPFVEYEVSRARALYLAAMPGIALLSADAQRCASACANGYAGILSAIEAAQYDTVTSRARLSHGARAAVLWRAWRYRPPVVDLASVRDEPLVEWERAPGAPARERVRWA
jgi:phytoene synthase